MEFALVNGQRHTAEPKLVGACPACGNRMLSKCGTKVLWHWAHHGRRHCDPWWENETEWHRSWKACFPEEWREQVQFDAKGEKHVADVKTPWGTVLEFQNSPMSPQELQVREQFYGRMLWIVNGRPFVGHFFILARLPSREASWARDVVFVESGRVFWRRSENPACQLGGLVLVHAMDEIQREIDRDYVGHHLYEWIRPRSVWFESQAPVYIDFGGDLLWQLQLYCDKPRLQCVRAIRKKALVTSFAGRYAETGEVVRTAKRPRRNDVVDRGEAEIFLHLIR